MDRKPLTMAILVISLTFFSYGCSTAALREKAEEMTRASLDAAKAYMAEEGKNLLAKAEAKAIEIADKKLKEAEDEKLKEIDAHLEPFAVVDPETGIATKKTWKDFDADKNGDLNEAEAAKIGLFITTQIAKKTASGEMSKDEAARHAKGTGITLAALMAILLEKRALASRKKSTTPPSGGGTATA